jgi:hypothetical protein
MKIKPLLLLIPIHFKKQENRILDSRFRGNDASACNCCHARESGHPASFYFLFSIISLICAASCGCALTDMNHLALTNLCDRTVTPDSQAGQWIMTPALIPAAVVTVAVDNFIIAPAVTFPSAILDASDFFQKECGGYWSYMGMLPFRLALTPVVFTGSWVARTIGGFTREDAWWGWPEWGNQWVRDKSGALLGPPDKFDPKTKIRLAPTPKSAPMPEPAPAPVPEPMPPAPEEPNK